MRRFRLTYANVVSTMALVLALGGGAYAATTQGPVQKAAPLGAAGPSVLGHRLTEKGVFDVGGMEAIGATQNAMLEAVTFAYPLSFTPKGRVLSMGVKTSACPGTVRKPTAKPGFLCLYMGGQWSNGSVVFLDPRTQGSVGIMPLGFVIYTTPMATTNSFGFDVHGTWAVTAP